MLDEIVEKMLKRAEELGLDLDRYRDEDDPDCIMIARLSRDLIMLDEPKRYQRIYVDREDEGEDYGQYNMEEDGLEFSFPLWQGVDDDY
ncbi:MAG: hypothetical protein ACYSTS_07770 [Planctomycetota bacterium]